MIYDPAHHTQNTKGRNEHHALIGLEHFPAGHLGSVFFTLDELAQIPSTPGHPGSAREFLPPQLHLGPIRGLQATASIPGSSPLIRGSVPLEPAHAHAPRANVATCAALALVSSPRPRRSARQ